MPKVAMVTDHALTVNGKRQTWMAGYTYTCDEATANALTSLGVATLQSKATPKPPVSEPVVESEPVLEQESPATLPEDMPYRDALIDDGFDTVEAINNATDEELVAINGIGYKALEKIRSYLAE